MSSIKTTGQPTIHNSELIILLVVGLLHGLLYWALMPPWQHYDEPSHFEYAQLIALRGLAEGSSGFDPTQRRAIADSMYRFRFDPPGIQRSKLNPEAPDIGIHQVGREPLYYLLAAQPIRLLASSPVEVQLYGARLVSLTFYLLTISCAYLVATALAPQRPLLRLGLPLLLIFSPTFSDIMTAVNNDALVNFSAAAFFLGSVLLIRDGIRMRPLLLTLLALSAALLSKRSSVQLLPMLPLVLYWALHRNPLHWWTYGAVAAGSAVVLGLLIFQLGPPPTASAVSPTPQPTALPTASVDDRRFRISSLPGQAGATRGPLISVQPWVDSLSRRALRVSPNEMLSNALDWERNRQRYPYALQNLFTTSTARLGWSHVYLPPFWDSALALGLAAAGCGLLLDPLLRALGVRQPLQLWRTRVDWFAFWSLVSAVAVVLTYLFLPSYDLRSIYFPTGRYLFIMLLPMLLLLLRGVEGCLPHAWNDYGVLGLVLFFLALDTTAWSWTILRFYYL